jgi:CheY-like chemotaxis protein
MPREKKILIVDDETISAMALEEYVQEKGYASAGLLATGEEAVALARAEEPDLVFMDFRLAGNMDGLEAARLINEERAVPVVIMSGYTEITVLEKARGYRPAAFLAKPYTFGQIDDLLSAMA